jgi:hypothetical protein
MSSYSRCVYAAAAREAADDVSTDAGELVTVEKISRKPLALVYASQLAEERIKHEITVEPDNVFKKGFVVDLNVDEKGGKPIAYSVTHVHQVIDLPDDLD